MILLMFQLQHFHLILRHTSETWHGLVIQNIYVILHFQLIANNALMSLTQYGSINTNQIETNDTNHRITDKKG